MQVMNTESPVEMAQLQKLVFEIVEQTVDSERKEELEEFLRDTWFGTPESLSEFAELFSDAHSDATIQTIAREYVEHA
jgi:CRISPR/Cas system-associated endonuclease/helicase Cas3